MAARQKPIAVIAPTKLELHWETYSAAARAAIEKDKGLLEAALATDRVIITLDDSLRQALAEHRDGEALLRNVQWIHPVTDGVAAIRAPRGVAERAALYQHQASPLHMRRRRRVAVLCRAWHPCGRS